MGKWVHQGFRLTGLIGLVLLGVMWFSQPAIASVHTYPEGENRVMIRSLQTVRDERDRAWQFVLFKRIQNGLVKSIHLRVVGFPDSGNLKHPADLHISNARQTWIASDVLPETPPFPANVGEYDVQAEITGLESNAPLELEIPTLEGNVQVTVPPFVVKEWRRVADGGQSF